MKHIYILIILSLLIISSCENKIEEINKFNTYEDLPDVSITDFNSYYSTEGITQVNIKAKLALKFSIVEKPFFEFPKGIFVTFYGEEKKANSTLKADYGIYYDKENFAKVEKNVVLKNTDGVALYTEQLFIDENKDKIYSIVPVRIVDKDGSEIKGKGGFESNLRFSAYRFVDVTGIQKYKDDIEDKNLQK